MTRAQPPAFPLTRGEDWASQGQPKRKPEIPVVTQAQIRTAFWGSSVRAVSFFKGVPAGADPGTQKLMHSEARAEPSPAPRPLEAWFMECRVRGSTAILGARSTCTRARPTWLLFCLSHKSGAGLVWGRAMGKAWEEATLNVCCSARSLVHTMTH